MLRWTTTPAIPAKPSPYSARHAHSRPNQPIALGPGGLYTVIFRQSVVAVGVLLALQYSLNLLAWFALLGGPLSGHFSIRALHRGISADLLIMTVPILIAAALFMRLEAVEER